MTSSHTIFYWASSVELKKKQYGNLLGFIFNYLKLNWFYRYVPPPPSRPRYNNNYDIESNHITNDNDVKSSNKNNQQKGFFVDVPPKFYKSSAKQQYYQQQYLNDLFSKNYYNKANKFSIIAFKDKYRGLPYYVVSH